MLIHGLQKMTLLDYPGKVAATVFLGGCDFRCPFCHNFELADGSAGPLMDDRELLAFLDKRKGVLDGVAITGGEPCINSKLTQLIDSIRSMGYLIKLDTNGYHPETLSKLISDKKVDYVAMDIKNSPEKYPMTVGVPGLNTRPIEESIELLLKGTCEYEFRTTVVKEYHEISDFEKIGDLIKGAEKYFLQQFTCRDTVPDKTLNPPSEDELNQYLVVVKKNVPNAQLRGV